MQNDFRTFSSCRRERDNSEAEKAQHMKQIHDLQEHIKEKESHFLALEEQVSYPFSIFLLCITRMTCIFWSYMELVLELQDVGILGYIYIAFNYQV